MKNHINYLLHLFRNRMLILPVIIIILSISLPLLATIPVKGNIKSVLLLFDNVEDYAYFFINTGRVIVLICGIILAHSVFTRYIYTPSEKEFLMSPLTMTKKVLSEVITLFLIALLEMFTGELFKCGGGYLFILINPSLENVAYYIIPSHINGISVLHTINMFMFLLIVSLVIVLSENVSYLPSLKKHKHLLFFGFSFLLLFIHFLINWLLFSLSGGLGGYISLILVQTGTAGFLFFSIKEIQSKITVY